MNISSILSTKRGEVFTIGPDGSVGDAISKLAELNIGALVVTDDDGNVVGIVSERDIIHLIARETGSLSFLVKEVMTKEVIVGLPEDDLMSVAHTMTERRFRHLPIVDGRRLVGIISIGDILKAQRDHYRGEIDTLETQIMADDV
jgi:CBS domain-containing protein